MGQHPAATQQQQQLRPFAWLVVGLALHWAALKQFELASIACDAAEPTRALRSISFIVAVGFFIAAGLAAIKRKQLEPLLPQRRRAVGALCAAGSLGYLTLLFASRGDGHPLPVFLLGGALVALGYATATFAFMDELVRRDTRETVAALPLSFLLAAGISLIAYLPRPVCLTLTVASPLLCGTALAMQGTPGRHDVAWSPTPVRSMPVAPTAILGLFIVIARIAIGLFNDIDAHISVDQRLFTVGLLAAVVLWILFTVRSKPAAGWDVAFRIGWCVPGTVAVIGVFMLVAPSASYIHIGLGALGASLDCLEMFLWLNLVLFTRDSRVSSMLIFSVSFSLFKMLPLVLGKIIAPFIAALYGFDFFPVALTMMVLLVAATVAFLTSTVATMQASVLENVRPADPRGDAIEGISSEAGLTARETEVLDYLSQGYSFHAIADMLGISVGTAQSYSKTLYRKVGVHSKQGLVDIIHERMGV